MGLSGAFAIWAGALGLVAMALAITRPNVVHALIWVVAGLISLAAGFFALGAGFAGAVQILIYAGAIIAVFIFVVMTIDSGDAALARERVRLGKGWKLPLVLVLAVLAPVALSLPGGGLDGAPVAVPAQRLGALLFGPWAVAVEVASAMLIAALLGARHLARREGGQ
ncbi:NADH-quinone oxidoreductase subunit J [Rhodobaculum claviforme]|uniref:NADH-quinone oxidoreductase subunit J n=1 Tax=Rhodobaculum claviforme TaxID=1549854 RepID=A0A934TMW1_9RHOB|nr:NADH-quinone oxidoreductase subunit J [Rhodobaculum claviforme]MBK5928822.1 NADH-quinone oxidoreductase subunit J [Rhodobaculum claviforme]